jgi:LemA protein
LVAGLLSLLRPLPDRVDESTLMAVDEAGTALLAASSALLSRPCSAEGPARLSVAEVGLQVVLGQVLKEVEHDHTLRLLPGMLERMAAISEAERRLRFGRQLYNDAVKQYNAALDEWPTRLLRRPFGWDPAVTV